MMTALCANADKIGEWKAYMAYGEITDIEPAENIVYVLSSNSIFSYNVNDESLTTYSKISPLSDCTATQIAWNSSAKRLIIIYDNYNIDLLDNNGNVQNIPDYYNKVMSADKTVNSILNDGDYAYLNTGFGIMKINVRAGEITDTYNLGKRVWQCAVKDGFIYANTEEGYLKGDMSTNLLDPANWVPTADNVSYANYNDISQTYDNGYAERYVYDERNKCYWSNQSDGKLQSYTLNDDNSRNITRSGINPDGPKYNSFGFLKFHNNKLYSCNGRMWDEGKPASIQLYDPDNDLWTTFANEGIGQKYGIRYNDILTLDIDPRDERRVIAGAQTGLFEFYDGKQTNYWNYQNSPIYFHYNAPNNVDYQLITSVIFDNAGNLYVANTGSTKNTMLRLNADNTWTTLDNFISDWNSGNMKFMGFNSRGQLWMYSDYWNHPATYLYDPSTEAHNEYSRLVNEDGAEFINVGGIRSLAEDRDGNIWVGMTHGLLVLPPEYQNDPTLGYYQIKVPRNDGTNLADYLLSGVDVSAIAIDNANRKWVGTNENGLYVISEDNMEEVHHFTKDNSSLLSNTVKSLAIDSRNGKVYIGTNKGLCSYQSEASRTNDDMNEDNVWAYPNPVRPEYTGMITITGLSHNADVKITTTNGTLVAQGRSTGGSFQWDGKDLKGRRVASGIYMVNTATENGDSGTVCKIAIIN